MKNSKVQIVLIDEFVEQFRSQGDADYPAVTYYGASNGKVYLIFPLLVGQTSNSPKFVFQLLDCIDLSFIYERKEVYIKIEDGWRLISKLELELQFYTRNLLPVIETKQTHKEAEDYLNKMLDE